MIFGAIIFLRCHSRPNDSLTLAEYESSSLAAMSKRPGGSITFWSKVRHHREPEHNDRLIFNNGKKESKRSGGGGGDICGDIKDPAEPPSRGFSESRPSLREDGARTVLLGCYAQ